MGPQPTELQPEDIFLLESLAIVFYEALFINFIRSRCHRISPIQQKQNLADFISNQIYHSRLFWNVTFSISFIYIIFSLISHRNYLADRVLISRTITKKDIKCLCFQRTKSTEVILEGIIPRPLPQPPTLITSNHNQASQFQQHGDFYEEIESGSLNNQHDYSSYIETCSSSNNNVEFEIIGLKA